MSASKSGEECWAVPVVYKYAGRLAPSSRAPNPRGGFPILALSTSLSLSHCISRAVQDVNNTSLSYRVCAATGPIFKARRSLLELRIRMPPYTRISFTASLWDVHAYS